MPTRSDSFTVFTRGIFVGLFRAAYCCFICDLGNRDEKRWNQANDIRWKRVYGFVCMVAIVALMCRSFALGLRYVGILGRAVPINQSFFLIVIMYWEVFQSLSARTEIQHLL